MSDIFEGNRAAWNQALKYHQMARGQHLSTGFENPHFTTFNRDYDHVLLEKLNQLDLNGKTIAQIPCNNGRELLSLMRYGAKEAIGFDISDAAIQQARQLAQIAKLNATFTQANALEIPTEYNSRFDFIFISQGSLQWFPCLDEYFGVISRLLNDAGQILIFEIHPFAYFFDNVTSYFAKGPYNYPKGLDYFGNIEYDSSECFWFMHKMSDIINALRRSSIEIMEFDEYNIDMDGNLDTDLKDKFPLSYIIVGKKNSWLAMPTN